MQGHNAPGAAGDRRRILVVDDHALMRRGLTALIDSAPDLAVCASAATHREALAAVAASRPDVVIVDVSLGDEDGLALLREVRAGTPGLPVLVLTIHDSRACAEQAFLAGASGYVTKQELDETLLLAIRRVLGGERYVSPKMRAALAAT